MKLSATCIAVCALASSTASAFNVQSSTTRGISYAFTRQSRTQLYDVIAAEAADEEVFDEGLGGVRLANESAIKVNGMFEDDNAQAQDLTRYKKVTELSDDIISKTAGVTIISTGTGNELYKDPGTSTTKEIIYAPLDAVKNALSSVPNASVSNAKKVSINFLGGEDMMIFEVMDAAKSMVNGLDISAKTTQVAFNSLCHSQFPTGEASVTVVATSGDDAEELTGTGKSVAQGEIYSHQGKYFTVTEDDINTAIA